MLVSTPVPETDDGCTQEYYVARELGIHRISRIGMEHVSGSETVVSGVTNLHHFSPTGSDATIAEHVQAQEQYQERTDNKNRCLDGR